LQRGYHSTAPIRRVMNLFDLQILLLDQRNGLRDTHNRQFTSIEHATSELAKSAAVQTDTDLVRFSDDPGNRVLFNVADSLNVTL
jgi:hypothetical protein